MTKDFLLEVGLEEMPAHVVTPSIIQLKKRVEDFLAEERLNYSSIDSFSTPRRLALRINDLDEVQEDISDEVKGPSKKIAQDAEGNWSKAAQGFVRGQGVTTEDIFFKEINGEDYVHVVKEVKGRSTDTILPDIVNCITSMTFPVSMHWNVYEFKFIRPIHWVIALYDKEIIPFSILDVTTGNQSRGHRFLGHDVVITEPKDYERVLSEQFVIVDATKRKQLIRDQIKELAAKHNWKIDVDENLLEEVNNLIEYSTAFAGEFAPNYLELPEEVLITSMKEHQRYFEVRDSEGVLVPYFVSVRNGNEQFIENVAKGNQKVLVARLEDAEFFYSEDQKLSIGSCVEKLKNVTFHEKIGDMYTKMKRVRLISQLVGKKVGLSDEELADLERASEIYKFDLVTNMVGEFPELQGIMGEIYALQQGEKPSVAKAIKEHYMPTSSEGALPESNVGAVLAISDKLDSVMSFFAVGMMPSGSNDPFSLRRQTYGIIRIIENKKWNFPFFELQLEINQLINDATDEFGIMLSHGQEVADFLKGRIRQRLSSQDIRHDIIDAVVESNQRNMSNLFEITDVIRDHMADNDFKESIEALTRVINLSKQNLPFDDTIECEKVNPELFENPSEQELYDAVNIVKNNFDSSSIEEEYLALANLRPLIVKYFDENMIMAENEAVRNNRLQQLGQIAELAMQFASLDLLIVK